MIKKALLTDKRKDQFKHYIEFHNYDEFMPFIFQYNVVTLGVGYYYRPGV